jgi:hypothetical protein
MYNLCYSSSTSLYSLPLYGSGGADADVRLARRIRRDTLERGRDVNGVIEQAWLLSVLLLIILMYTDSSLKDPSGPFACSQGSVCYLWGLDVRVCQIASLCSWSVVPEILVQILQFSLWVSPCPFGFGCCNEASRLLLLLLCQSCMPPAAFSAHYTYSL